MPATGLAEFHTEKIFVPNYEETHRKVVGVIAESLYVKEDEIQPTSTLQGDLGAESIDFLDIVFRLEQEFGIEIPRDELFPESIFHGNPDLVQDGRVSAKGLEELRARMPLADLSEFEKNPEVSHAADLFNVDLVTKYVHSKLENSRRYRGVAG
jgi:acyl carrier protein